MERIIEIFDEFFRFSVRLLLLFRIDLSILYRLPSRLLSSLSGLVEDIVLALELGFYKIDDIVAQRAHLASFLLYHGARTRFYAAPRNELWAERVLFFFTRDDSGGHGGVSGSFGVFGVFY